jgi:sugar fermentation stimulation protein A
MFINPPALIRIRDFLQARVLEKLNRFVVLVEMEGRIRRAHINNTGRLERLLAEGRRGYLLPAKPGGKTDFRLFAVEDGEKEGALFDTQFQMRAVEQALAGGLLPWARGCRMLRRSPRLGESVMDYLLDCGGTEVFWEVKSAALRTGDFATYPDCPTLRGRRHIRELTRHSEAGGRAVILFVGALPRVKGFRPYDPGDPEIAPLLRRADAAGVAIHAIRLQFNPVAGTIDLTDPSLPVSLNGGLV